MNGRKALRVSRAVNHLLVVFVAAIVCAAAPCSLGALARIGVNITAGSDGSNPDNRTLTSTDMAGVGDARTTGWYNNFDMTPYDGDGYIKNTDNAIMSSLVDSEGITTGVSVTVNERYTGLNGILTLGNAGAWNGNTSASSLTPEQKLYNARVGVGGDRTTEFVLTGIEYERYDLYVYLSYSEYQAGRLQVFEGNTAGGAGDQYYFSDGLPWTPGTHLPTTYAQVTSTDSENPSQPGSAGAYVLFSGLSDSAVAFDLVGSYDGGVAGFQIVEIPEPGGLALLAVGLLAVMRRH